MEIFNFRPTIKIELSTPNVSIFKIEKYNSIFLGKTEETNLLQLSHEVSSLFLEFKIKKPNIIFCIENPDYEINTPSITHEIENSLKQLIWSQHKLKDEVYVAGIKPEKLIRFYILTKLLNGNLISITTKAVEKARS